jgi:long-chain acyl-CoA synthetase
MDFRRLFELFDYQQSDRPLSSALARPEGRKWKRYSSAECKRIVQQLSLGFLAHGLARGERVVILADQNSPAWIFCDMALQQAGAVVVPLHPANHGTNLEAILREVAPALLIAQTADLLRDYLSPQSVRDLPRGTVLLQPAPDYRHWEELMLEVEPEQEERLQALRAVIHEDDLATIIYTSGTQGRPKGVMLSHKNLVSNIKACLAVLPLRPGERVLSYLPYSHVFERTVLYVYLAAGASVYVLPDAHPLETALPAVRPHYFTAVPRVLERMKELMLERAGSRSGLLRRLVHWAVRIGERERPAAPAPGYYLQLMLAWLLVFRAWRRRLGGRLKGIAVGAAALNEQIGRLFSAAGIVLREGYGLTEASPVVAFNRFEPGGYRLGTVGLSLPGVKVRIQPLDGQAEGLGEILVKGPNVMLGYFRQEDHTAEVLDPDGWLHTGDLGTIVDQRFLKVTGRARAFFKTSRGLFVSPEQLETRLKSSSYISQCMVFGFGKPFVGAVLIPNFTLLRQWCEEQSIHWTAPQYMVHNHLVQDFFRELLEELNAPLPAHQRVREFVLAADHWTPQSGELSFTLKPKRAVLLEKYAKAIRRLYEERD